MSNVRIQISNKGTAGVLVNNPFSGATTTVASGADPWFTVVEGSVIRISYNQNPLQIVVEVNYVKEGDSGTPGKSSVTLDLHTDSSVYVHAQESLSLTLIGEGLPQPEPALAVKCGEIIIYPPA